MKLSENFKDCYVTKKIIKNMKQTNVQNYLK